MWDGIADTTLVTIFGLLGGMVLGLSARLGRFCTLGAIEDFFYQDSTMRLRMWGLAIGVAVLCSFGLIGIGLLDPSAIIYLNIAWNPFASVFGGLVFGYGMALAGNCGFGALARLGGGDLRAFVIVLVMGVSSFVALSGPLAQFRVSLFPTTLASDPKTTGMAHWLAAQTGLSPLVFGLAIGAAILALSVASRDFLKDRVNVITGTAVGLAIASGWAGTNWVAAHGFAATPVQSHSFSVPLGDTLIYAMTSSGSSLNFGIGSVVGVLAGALIGSLIKGHFRWEACEDHRELRRQIIGAALMGVGAVIALGCTIGQGISAFSLLAFSAPVTFLSIMAGTWIGLRQLITGFASA
ncbi:MAG: YeeE/YedE family protein [Marinosulfonomonas sp.]